MSRWWWLFAIMTWTSVGQAEAPVGVAYFAINKFTPSQCRTALSVFKGVEKPFLSILWHGFGTNDSCVEKFLADPREKTLLVHPFNTTCTHSNRLGTCKNEPDWNDAGIVSHRVDEVYRFFESRRNDTKLHLIVSLGLEDTHSLTKARTLTKRVLRPLFFNIARSTLHETQLGRVTGVRFDELHGRRFPRAKSSRPRILSNDGYDVCSTVRRNRDDCLPPSGVHHLIRNSKRSKDYFVIWWNAQGIGGQGDRITDPFSRTIRIYRKDVNAVRNILHAYQSN